jgi:mono/diheme cytochrome c family protein
VFARGCADCHLANGSAGVDLSTEASWTALRNGLQQRVIVARTMPPSGHRLSDADREQIRAWLELKPAAAPMR